MLILKRRLPSTKQWLMLLNLRNHLKAEIFNHKCRVWKCHSKYIWNKYYEKD